MPNLKVRFLPRGSLSNINDLNNRKRNNQVNKGSEKNEIIKGNKGGKKINTNVDSINSDSLKRTVVVIDEVEVEKKHKKAKREKQT